MFIVLCMISCVKQENKTGQWQVIDIEQSLQNLTELKVSDFGRTIRYIPLETTDDCLIGNEPTLKVLKNFIIVESQREKQCLLFNKKDGSFVTKIGHTGQDPAAYTDEFGWIDENEAFLYFQRGSNQLLKYDMKGNFCGKVEFATPPGIASFYLLSDSELIGYYSGLNQQNDYAVGFFDKEGVLQDTIPLLIERIPVKYDNIESISVTKGKYTYGSWGRAGAIHFTFKDDKKAIIASYVARLWRNNGNIRFKEDFVDTIYTISDRKLIPTIVFDNGKYHWSPQEITNSQNTNGRIFIGDVYENDTFVFFQCVRGMHSHDVTLYNGLYHKESDKTKLGDNSKPIQDDLTRFMPFKPLSMSTSGEFVSYLEAFHILDWLDEHPEAKNNEALSFLKNLEEDMNPVVVLIE